MSLIKNRATLFAVVRKDIDKGQDVVCCFAKTLDKAERLADEYGQQFVDSGGSYDEAYYYVVANTFYDE